MRIARLLVVVALLGSWCMPSCAQNVYFPRRSFDARVQFDQDLATYYARELKLLGEPSLLELSKNHSSQAYRFIWLRSFHKPVSVRLDVKADGTGLLTVKVGSGAAGFLQRSDVMIENTSRPIVAAQVEVFLARVESVQFWQAPSYIEGNQTGTDGSDWIVESVRGGNYHVAARWSPLHSNATSKRAVRELGLALAIDLAQMKIPEHELY